MPRLTIYGHLVGVHKDATGKNYIMTVRTETGEYKDYPHDNVEVAKTANVKRKSQ